MNLSELGGEVKAMRGELAAVGKSVGDLNVTVAASLATCQACQEKLGEHHETLYGPKGIKERVVRIEAVAEEAAKRADAAPGRKTAMSAWGGLGVAIAGALAWLAQYLGWTK